MPVEKRNSRTLFFKEIEQPKKKRGWTISAAIHQIDRDKSETILRSPSMALCSISIHRPQCCMMLFCQAGSRLCATDALSRSQSMTNRSAAAEIYKKRCDAGMESLSFGFQIRNTNTSHWYNTPRILVQNF